MPLPDGRRIPVDLRGGGAPGGDMIVNLTVIHQPGAGQDTATASRQGNAMQIKAMIWDAVAEGVAQPGNQVRRSLEHTSAPGRN